MDENIRLVDLIDVPVLQNIQDSFSKMARMATLITDHNGKEITVGSNFSEYCMEYCRKSPIGKKRCEECDKMGAVAVLSTKQPYSYYCHANLVDFAAPIMLGDRMIGSFIGGQVLTEPPDLEKMREIAKEIGVDEEGFIEAAQKIQIIPKAAVDRSANFIYKFAGVISDLAYKAFESRRLSEEAMQAARMKSDFLANMSHEIRTPMNAILGMAEMALREDMSPDAREYIHQIKSSGKNLLVIINDILDFSKIESGKMDIIEVNYEPFSLMSDISSIVNSRIGDKDIEYVMDISYNIPCRLIGDNVRIQQILINLLNNAVKFTARGMVRLSLSFEPLDDDRVMLKAAVTDTGLGIKKEDIGKLFQSFNQVDSKRNRNVEGTGLGLAITQQLLHLMGGRISVESEYEKGSSFFVEVPQKVIGEPFRVNIPDKPVHAAVLVKNIYLREQIKKDLCAVNVSCIDLSDTGDLSDITAGFVIIDHDIFESSMMDFAQSHPEITFIVPVAYNCSQVIKMSNVRTIRKPVYSLNLYAQMGICEEITRDSCGDEDNFVFTAPDAHILIVDDNPINLTVAKGLLEPLNMQIDLADGASECIKKVNQKKYDIIFMDHMMPEVDGVETTHIIRRLIESYAEVPIIALTANAVGGTREMFLKEGMNDFVAKPIEIKEIVAKIRKWLPKEKIVPSDKCPCSAAPAPRPEIIIEDLNTASALSLLGSEALFRTVLKEYFLAIDKKAAVINENLASGNIKNYTVEVHSLKSTSKQIGAEKLSAMAARLEQAGNENDTEYINGHNEEMIEEFLHYKPILQRFFPDVVIDEGRKTADSEATLELLDEVVSALDDMDILHIDEVMEQISAYEFDDIESGFLAELKNGVEEFDMDSCGEIIAKWKQKLTG